MSIGFFLLSANLISAVVHLHAGAYWLGALNLFSFLFLLSAILWNR